MLPTQILLNNFLYDLAQVTIPTDNVDPSFIRKPQRWDIGMIRNFMLLIGPISSLYDFLTFFVLLQRLPRRGGAVPYRLVRGVAGDADARALRDPHRGQPVAQPAEPAAGDHHPGLIVLVGLLLPFTPLAGALGFTPLPAGYFLFLAGASATYLLLVEIAKRRLMREFLA